VKAFRNVLAGRRHFDAVPPPKAATPATNRHGSLSAREYKVLLALAAGKRSGEIAAELNLSGKTVSTYKRRILNKLHLRSTSDLVHYVIDNQLS
jgi:DNA-binding NarL/FixJ family response regulator